jgi:uncharacterized protein YraI
VINLDIYLKNEKLNEEFHFPVNPLDKMVFKRSKRFETLDIVDVGEVDVLKRGKNLDPLSFSTLFPKEYGSFCRYKDIPDPKTSVEKIEKWMFQEEPLRLIITDFDFNDLVTIADFETEDVSGEIGDKYISITFRAYKELKIEELPIPEKNQGNITPGSVAIGTKKMIVSVGNSRLNVRSGPSTSYSIIGKLYTNNEVDVYEVKNGWAKIKYSKGKDGVAYVSSKYLKEKPSSPKLDNNRSNTQSKSKNYTVVKGDSLWKISKKIYSDGSKWRKIYDANKKTIGSNPDIIKAGMKLVIP